MRPVGGELGCRRQGGGTPPLPPPAGTQAGGAEQGHAAAAAAARLLGSDHGTAVGGGRVGRGTPQHGGNTHPPATVGMPSLRAVRKTRHAISPRLATNSLPMAGGCTVAPQLVTGAVRAAAAAAAAVAAARAPAASTLHGRWLLLRSRSASSITMLWRYYGLLLWACWAGSRGLQKAGGRWRLCGGSGRLPLDRTAVACVVVRSTSQRSWCPQGRARLWGRVDWSAPSLVSEAVLRTSHGRSRS